jgi:hypothetical protein
MQQLNAYFLNHGSNSLRLLSKVVDDPSGFAAQAKDFTDRVTQLQTSGGDQEEKFQDFVAGWVEEQSVKRTAKDQDV